MESVLLHIFPWVFVITWVGVGVILFFRAQIKRNAFLRRASTGIGFFAGDPLFYPGSLHAYRDTVRVMRQRQPDAELEHRRRQMWQSFRSFLIWVFGFPIIAIGAAALVISTGLPR